jgi:uncharacterized membrane protein YtjA (UPF0391 family)
MLPWTIGFLLVAILAAVLGYSGLAGRATHMTRILCLLSVVLFLVSFLGNTFPERDTRTPSLMRAASRRPWQ